MLRTGRRETRASYAGVVAEVMDVIDSVVPEGATVLVVSKGDEQLVELPRRQGWHFPRADDGRYLGYYPKGDDDAVAHLDVLLEQGAEFLVLPETSFWWLEHYPGLSRILMERHRLAVATDRCKVFDLREVDAAGAAADVRKVVDAVVPPRRTVIVASNGDELLLDLGDREAWHFPRSVEGHHRRHQPESDEDSIAHLEELRAAGAQYLVLPSAAAWWLHQFPGFARYVRGHYRVASDNGVTALVFELGERNFVGLVSSLIPPESRIAVLSDVEGDVAGLHAYAVVRLPLGDGAEVIEMVDRVAREGSGFLAIPPSSLAWSDQHVELREHLRATHAFVTRQRYAGEIWQLEAPPGRSPSRRRWSAMRLPWSRQRNRG